jgi:drug/metabolite transporter (DMT)-like permease
MRYAGIDCSVKDYKSTNKCWSAQKNLIIRSLITFVTVALYISAIKYIPIGIANALHNTSPIMTFFI